MSDIRRIEIGNVDHRLPLITVILDKEQDALLGVEITGMRLDPGSDSWIEVWLAENPETQKVEAVPA